LSVIDHVATSDTILVDTGPLLTLLTLDYLRETGAAETRRGAVLADIRAERQWTVIEEELFSELLSQYSRLLTTPHVVAEAFKLRAHAALKGDQHRFRRLAMSSFKKANLQEVHCPLVDLALNEDSVEWVCNFGATDAMLLHVSMKEACLILTDDTRLLRAGTGRILVLDRELSAGR
jgi:hypothetical protein